MTDGIRKKEKHAPGAGLPFCEGWFLRRIACPLLMRTCSVEKATERIRRIGGEMVADAKSLSREALVTKVRIRRPFGLEHSSTNWSVAMVLEHLVFVGSVFGKVIERLSNGKVPRMVIDPGQAKPRGELENPIEAFQSWLDGYLEKIAATDLVAHPELCHPHPWVGELDAREWHVFNSAHLGVHRKQLNRVIAGLREQTTGR